jgi:putative oxidoreductase
MTTAATLIIIGRFLMGAMFVVFGIRNLRAIDRLTVVQEKRGQLPQPRLWMMAGVAIQLIGGLMVAFNILAWLGALALIAFLLLAAYLFHAPWEHPADERGPHISACLLNTALAGGFLIVLALSL